jgi:hypothetical protein
VGVTKKSPSPGTKGIRGTTLIIPPEVRDHFRLYRAYPPEATVLSPQERVRWDSFSGRFGEFGLCVPQTPAGFSSHRPVFWRMAYCSGLTPGMGGCISAVFRDDKKHSNPEKPRRQ